MKKMIVLLAAAIFAVLFLSACHKKSVPRHADLPKVLLKMKEAAENSELMDLTKDNLMPDYGINPDDVRQFAACLDSTGTKGDEIFLAEGIDEAAAGRIREKLEQRYKQKQTEMKDYLPKEYAVLKECGVKKDGEYVSLIVSPKHESLEKIYGSALGR